MYLICCVTLFSRLAAYCGGLLFLLAYAGTSYSQQDWYAERLNKVVSKYQCHLKYGDNKAPGYFLITPQYFVSWCSHADSTKNNLIAFSSLKNSDWKSCSEFIGVNESIAKHNIRVKKGVDPYGKLFPIYKFWTLDSINKDAYDYLEGDELASGNGIYYGVYGNIEQILYCYKGQWVMTGYH